MFGKAKVYTSNVWTRQNLEFQYLEKPEVRIPVFAKREI